VYYSNNSTTRFTVILHISQQKPTLRTLSPKQ